MYTYLADLWNGRTGLDEIYYLDKGLNFFTKRDFIKKNGLSRTYLPIYKNINPENITLALERFFYKQI